MSLPKFTRAFWVANVVELLERLAYYAVFIVITLYLSNIWGFSDIEAGLISGVFSASLYFLPTFVGAYADRIGFRRSIILAFALLTLGYFGLGLLPTLLESAGLVSYGDTTVFSGLPESPLRWSIVPVMILIVVGGAFVKAVISGTVARETTSENRARGYAIFYMMVNIGAFTGKSVVDPLRKSLGDMGLVYLNYFAAAMTLLALIAVFFLYKSSQTQGEGKSLREIWRGLVKVFTNARLIVLILIISGFWMIQSQMYATMPKYVIRLIGESASPGWYANVNPLVVFLLVNFITSLMAKKNGPHFHDHRHGHHSALGAGYVAGASIGKHSRFGNAPGGPVDGDRYRHASSGRMLYFAPFSGVFFLAGSQRRRRPLPGIQPFTFLHFLFVRLRALGFSAR